MVFTFSIEYFQPYSVEWVNSLCDQEWLFKYEMDVLAPNEATLSVSVYFCVLRIFTEIIVA